jgi:hypothetical protein
VLVVFLSRQSRHFALPVTSATETSQIVAISTAMILDYMTLSKRLLKSSDFSGSLILAKISYKGLIRFVRFTRMNQGVSLLTWQAMRFQIVYSDWEASDEAKKFFLQLLLMLELVPSPLTYIVGLLRYMYWEPKTLASRIGGGPRMVDELWGN